jgi:hypothetical protein
MSNTREYLLNSLGIAAASIGLEFAKKSPEDLQHWVEDLVGNKDFIALVALSSAEGDTPVLSRFSCSFVSSSSLNWDPTKEERDEAENKAERQAMQFLYVVKSIPAVQLDAWALSETFRHQSFNGIGKGLSFTIQLLDKNDYCALVLPEFPE